MPELIREEIRKANKNHTCDYCLGTIKKGELYRVDTLKLDDVYRWKSHRECEFIADEFHRSGLFEDHGNGMVQEDFEECVEEVHNYFVNPQYVHGQTFQIRLKEVYDFLCENKIERFATMPHGSAFKAVKRELPVILDYMQGEDGQRK
jgi:hypothetical protein